MSKRKAPAETKKKKKQNTKSKEEPLYRDGVYLEEFNVEKILAKKVLGDATYYLVKWENYPENEATWEPVAHLDNVAQMLAEFNARHSPPKSAFVERVRRAKSLQFPTVSRVSRPEIPPAQTHSRGKNSIDSSNGAASSENEKAVKPRQLRRRPRKVFEVETRKRKETKKSKRDAASPQPEEASLSGSASTKMSGIRARKLNSKGYVNKRRRRRAKEEESSNKARKLAQEDSAKEFPSPSDSKQQLTPPDSASEPPPDSAHEHAQGQDKDDNHDQEQEQKHKHDPDCNHSQDSKPNHDPKPNNDSSHDHESEHAHEYGHEHDNESNHDHAQNREEREKVEAAPASLMGSLATDVPSRVIEVRINNGILVCEIRWKPRANGTTPSPGLTDVNIFKEAYPRLLLDYYEHRFNIPSLISL